MATNRIIRDGAVRRATLLLIACLGLALALGACGDGGGESSDRTITVVADKDADAEVLNELLSRQKGSIDAYDLALPKLAGQSRELAAELRAQEQQHVDGLLEALRGSGGEEGSEVETIEPGGPLKTEADALTFLYELESATIDAELAAVGRLTSSGPRTLVAATLANQAQHLVLLRRLLGADPLGTVPGAFENGATPAP